MHRVILMEKNWNRAVKRIIRVSKKESAFVYAIFESYEGITSYSTLDCKPEDSFRDLELYITPDYVSDVDELLKNLGNLIISS